MGKRTFAARTFKARSFASRSWGPHGATTHVITPVTAVVCIAKQRGQVVEAGRRGIAVCNADDRGGVFVAETHKGHAT